MAPFFMYMPSCRLLTVLIAVASAGAQVVPRPPARSTAAAPVVRPATWSEVAPIVERLSGALPSDLRDAAAADRPARWQSWAQAHRQALTARLAAGDLDSVVNLLLFGTSFTSQPRVTPALLADLDKRWAAGDASAQQTLTQAYQQRALDLVTAAGQSARRNDERLSFVTTVLGSHGIDVSTEAGRRAGIDFLIQNVVRVHREAAALAKQLEAVRAQPDPTTAFAERSKLFRDRGLSADSSVLTQFAVDRALCSLADRKVFAKSSIMRVGIVGPGLDFVDKQEGFDFYQPQSLQPFTTADSLRHCALAAAAPEITTIDVSERVNRHLRSAIDRASKARAAYRIVLPWDSGAGWSEDAAAYWKRAGDGIGTAFQTKAPPLPGVRARGVSVRPDVAARIHAIEATIVTDRLELPDSQRFDLIVATNVLIYYDTFEQTLALANIAAMLRPGGVLLTNDAVLEIPEVPLRSQGSLAVPFSARAGDGERMIWYVR